MRRLYRRFINWDWWPLAFFALMAAAGVAIGFSIPLDAFAADPQDAPDRRPDTAGDLGRGAGNLLGGILRVTPVLGQGLDAFDGQRAKLKSRRARRAAEREALRVRGMQFSQCVANPCLYGAVCPQLFPHFIIPDCPAAAAAASPPSPPPPPPPAPGNPAAPAADAAAAAPAAAPAPAGPAEPDPWRPRVVDRGHEPCAEGLIGGAWRCWDGRYIWDPDLEFEWDGADWVPARDSGKGS